MSRAEAHRADMMGLMDEVETPSTATHAREADRLGVTDECPDADIDADTRSDFERRMAAAVTTEESSGTDEIAGSEALLAENSARFREGRGHQDDDIISATRFIDGQTPGGM